MTWTLSFSSHSIICDVISPLCPHISHSFCMVIDGYIEHLLSFAVLKNIEYGYFMVVNMSKHYMMCHISVIIGLIFFISCIAIDYIGLLSLLAVLVKMQEG